MSNLTDFVPLLQVIPNPVKARGKRLHDALVKTYGGLINEIDGRLRAALPVKHCLAKTMLASREEEGLDDLDMAILASAFMIGGVETVSIECPLCEALIALTSDRPLQSCNGSLH